MGFRVALASDLRTAIVLDDAGRQVAWGELRLADQYASPERMDVCAIELVITGTPADNLDWDHLLDDYQRDTGASTSDD